MTDERTLFPITSGAELEAAKKWKEAIKTFVSDIEAIEVEERRRKEARIASFREEARHLWNTMTISLGVDANETWDNREWAVDAQYVEHGFAALIHEPRPRNAFADLLGQLNEPGGGGGSIGNDIDPTKLN